MFSYDLSLDEALSVSGPVTQQHFGANYVYNYERFGDQPWEKYDEVIRDIGLTNIRYPGGNAIETNFDFTDPNSETNLWGESVTPLDKFIEFTGSHDLDATIIIPTSPFLWGHSHEFIVYDNSVENWVVDDAKLASVKGEIVTFIRGILEDAQTYNARIYAIELGNEYPGVDWTTPNGDASKMNAKQYGTIANELAKIVQETIDTFNTQIDGAGQDPQIVAQIWGDYNQGGLSTDSLRSANESVLGQFDAQGLAAVDAVSDHVYFKELKSNSAGETHSYETLSDMIIEMVAMSDSWDQAAGRDLDVMITEWNIQKFSFYDPGPEYWVTNDSWRVSQDWINHSNFGLRQVAPMIEMFAAFLTAGVDSTHIWSVMYSSSALGTHMNGGQLFAGGGIMQLMQDELIGTHYVELGLQTQDHDIHLFEGDTSGHVFVSSLRKDAQEITLDLNDFGRSIENIKIKYLKADQANADGQFTINGTTYILPDTDHAYLEADLSLLIETGEATLEDGKITVSLGAFETAYISFDHDNPMLAHMLFDRIEVTGSGFFTDGAAFSAALHGTGSLDTVDGLTGMNTINGSGFDDVLAGYSDNDVIYGAGGNDTITGGDGDDRLFGGSGYDDMAGTAVGSQLWGSFGIAVSAYRGGNDDTLKGGAGNDFIVGGDGNDLLEGGSGNDVLTGGLHSDTFVFEGVIGHDIITDFDSDEDQIAINSPEALTALSNEELLQEYASQVGSDVLIDLENDNSITLRNVSLAELEEVDFFAS